MNIALFANTGLGNEVLKNLLKIEGIKVKIVLSHKLEGTFPYYKEQDLNELCNEFGVNVVNNLNVNDTDFIHFLKEMDLDLIIVSSFNQIIKEEVINIPKKGILNFHPSLLPKYRGSNPINWVLLNNEDYTGITVHNLVRQIDAGNILLQKEYKILPYQNLGELFKQLALLSGSLVEHIIKLYIDNKEVNGYLQDESEMSYYKKPFGYNESNDSMDIHKLIKRLRAFIPFPGLNFNYQSTDYVIKSYEVCKKELIKRNEILHYPSKEIFVVPSTECDLILKYI